MAFEQGFCWAGGIVNCFLNEAAGPQAETTSATSALEQQTTTEVRKAREESSTPLNPIQLGTPLLACTNTAKIGLLATGRNSESLGTFEILAFLAGPEISVTSKRIFQLPA
jgi:hypothetical protein